MISTRHSLTLVSLLASVVICLADGSIDATASKGSSAVIKSRKAPPQFAALLTPSMAPLIYKWNIEDRQGPLLGFPEDRIAALFDQTLTYSSEGFDFPIFKALNFDELEGKYLLPTISRETGSIRFIEFAPAGSPNLYASIDGTNVQLLDQDTMKTFRTVNGAKYIFVRHPDGEFRCAIIKPTSGVTLHLLYSANGLTLHGIVDSTSRSITFNYGKDGISSITQTWMTQLEGFTKTWQIGDQVESGKPIKYAHSVVATMKAIPANALMREYTADMAASDTLLAEIFGGPGAVAGANGFEPAGLGTQYPLYRGDFIGDDGKLRSGHLSHAMHLYGSADGRGDSPLYVPAGFTSHSSAPSPTDAAVLFYYPKLGNLTDVTLAVFHVADFQIRNEGNRVRIGRIGGPGGLSPLYKHSHIDFYRGNTSLPPAHERVALRIDPSTVFGKR